MTNESQVVLKRVALKDLEPDLSNTLIVALIIGKQRPRKFENRPRKNGAGEADGPGNPTFQAVWNFTIRDSPRDYINVTYWGSADDVFAANDKFYTGDIVELTRVRISIRQFGDSGERYRPMVTSPYFLTLNECSSIQHHGGNASLLTRLLSLPTKPIAAFVPLKVIQNEGNSMKDNHMDILVAVRQVGEIRNITSKNGVDIQLREVILFDHTSSGVKLTIWDPEIMTRANSWRCRHTILFITDIRVEYSQFSRSFGVALTNRSIVTEQPIGKDSASLAEYAKNAPLDPTAILECRFTHLPDPESIQNVLTIQQVQQRIASLVENEKAGNELTALMFVFVTKLDLDGINPIVTGFCEKCKSYVRDTSKNCTSSECAESPVLPEIKQTFDLRVNLTDHTGNLGNCRLTGQAAENVLNCSVDEFFNLSKKEKSDLKWRFLMERCDVRIMILPINNNKNPSVSIVSCSKSNPTNVAQRLPHF